MTESVLDYMTRLGRAARQASRLIARASTAQKNRALLAAADALDASRSELAAANELDLANGRANGLEPALLDRLALTPARIDDMAEGLRQIAKLPDPIGEISDMSYRPSGIQVGKMRVPLGVIGIIYESRPNVTADAAGLCLKSGNAAILRGGSEAIHSNQAIAACMQRRPAPRPACRQTAVQVVETTDRAAVGELITMNGVRRRDRAARRQGPDRARQSRVAHPGDQAPGRRLPCLHRRSRRPRQGDPHRRQRQDPALRHLQHHGNAAGAPPASRNGSCRRWRKSICDKGVELRGCERTRARSCAHMKPAHRGRLVHRISGADPVDPRRRRTWTQAIEHIDTYGSQHTDAIVTEDIERRAALPARSGFQLGDGQCLDALRRRLRVRPGRRDRHLHRQAPRTRPGRPGRPDHEKYIVLGDGQVRGSSDLGYSTQRIGLLALGILRSTPCTSAICAVPWKSRMPSRWMSCA